MRKLINGCCIDFCRYMAEDDVGQLKFLERNIGGR
jgi:hypothetical protein